MTSKFTKIISLVIALAAPSAQALPTLDFNGNISFDATTKQLSVMSTLIATHDILPEPSLVGTLNFDALLNDTFFGFGVNVGTFGTIAGQDDITVLDANNNILLTGNFTSLIMSGTDNADSGSITGEMVSTGGSLAAQFGAGNVLALAFNLPAFNETMFDSNFAGNINGEIKGVPEPSLLALLSIGILAIGYAGKRSRASL